jgi:hypothetical protein
VSGDKAARVLAGLTVLAVAVVAGWVSFGHVAVLAAAHGYSSAAAHMLPVSVDGLIVASSMALLTGSAPWLSRAGLVLGILATLAANVAAGAEFGVVGAVVNAWPAVAFIVASEILLRMLRAAPDIPSANEAGETVAADVPTAPVAVPETVAATVPVDVPKIEPVAVPARTLSPVPGKRARTVAPGRAPKRAPVGRAKAPERVFAAEIEAGELPSLRQVKERMHVGTPRAREILSELTEMTGEKAA